MGLPLLLGALILAAGTSTVTIDGEQIEFVHTCQAPTSSTTMTLLPCARLRRWARAAEVLDYQRSVCLAEQTLLLDERTRLYASTADLRTRLEESEEEVGRRVPYWFIVLGLTTTVVAFAVGAFAF